MKDPFVSTGRSITSGSDFGSFFGFVFVSSFRFLIFINSFLWIYKFIFVTPLLVCDARIINFCQLMMPRSKGKKDRKFRGSETWPALLLGSRNFCPFICQSQRMFCRHLSRTLDLWPGRLRPSASIHCQIITLRILDSIFAASQSYFRFISAIARLPYNKNLLTHR